MTEDDIESQFSTAAAHAVRYRRGAGARPHVPLERYGESLARFQAPLPLSGTRSREVIDELVALAEPGLHNMVGPRFFGWVIGSSHPVGVAADMLASAWGQNSGNHTASPAAAAAEAVVAGWLLDLLDLPRESSVGFTTGATAANFVCLAAARGEVLRRAGWDADGQGLFGAPPITIVIGDDAHTTIFSALQFLGLGRDRVRRVATDSQGTILPSAFAEALAGVRGPVIVALQAGQLNTGGFDRFEQIIPMAHAAGAWVHVDGAFGLWARAAPSVRHLAKGVGGADSWATDGHKWLQTPYDCGYAIVREELAHRRAMTIAASYLPAAAAEERDPSHYVPELSRRARGFASWAMIRHLGREGIAAMIERHCRVAKAMASRLEEEPGIAVLNDVVLNQVIVRFGGDLDAPAGDALTGRTIARVLEDGVCFAGGAKWRGQLVMRISVINFCTDEAEGLKGAEAMIAAYRHARSTR